MAKTTGKSGGPVKTDIELIPVADHSKIEEVGQALIAQIAEHDPETILNSVGIELIAQMIARQETIKSISAMLGIPVYSIPLWIKKDNDRKEIIEATKGAVADELLEIALNVAETEKDAQMLSAKTKAYITLAGKIRPQQEVSKSDVSQYNFYIDAGVDIGLRPEKQISGYEVQEAEVE